MKTPKSKLAIFLCAVLAAVLCVALVGCSGNSAPKKDTGAVKITDATGAEFSLDKPVTKVVGTHNVTLNVVVAIGGGGQYLAGFGNKAMADGLYKEVIEDWENLPQIGKGKNINVEAIAALDPPAELAVLPERQAAMAEEYAKVGLDSLIALPNQESFETVKESVTRVGAIFGENERAKQINEKYDAILKGAQDAVAKATDKPSVLFLGQDLYSVAPNAMIQTYIIEAAGGTNAVFGIDKKGGFESVDAESIAKFNPDVIWIPAYANYTVDDILNDAKLAEVKAVKDGKVFMFPCKLEPWDYSTPSSCLGVAWAANNLHPDLYKDSELKSACDDFYKLLYNKTFTEEQLGLK